VLIVLEVAEQRIEQTIRMEPSALPSWVAERGHRALNSEASAGTWAKWSGEWVGISCWVT